MRPRKGDQKPVTQTEFNTWLRHHLANFTNVASWLGKFPDLESAASENRPTQRAIQQGWFRVLRDVELTDAMAATDAMKNGDEEQPRSFDDFPKYVRKITQRRRKPDRSTQPWQRRTADGEETFACLDCRDVGAVTIWHPRAVIQRVLDGELWEAIRTATAAIRCTCRAANKYRWMGDYRYDREKHLRHEPGMSLRDPDTRQAIEEFCDRLRLAGGMRGFSEFADFAE